MYISGTKNVNNYCNFLMFTLIINRIFEKILFKKFCVTNMNEFLNKFIETNNNDEFQKISSTKIIMCNYTLLLHNMMNIILLSVTV